MFHYGCNNNFTSCNGSDRKFEFALQHNCLFSCFQVSAIYSLTTDAFTETYIDKCVFLGII